jgi:hypothetical protein
MAAGGRWRARLEKSVAAGGEPGSDDYLILAGRVALRNSPSTV